MNAHGPIDSASTPPSPRAGIGADQALAGLRLAGPGVQAGLDRFRLSPAAAGALRAALDCLLADAPGVTLQVMGDESALEVRCARIEGDDLVAAAGVIEAVEGNLAPTPGVPGSWSVRLPLLTPRETFLVVECGELSLALPWHAVTRVRMIGRDALVALAAQEGIPVVNPLGLSTERAGESPAVLVGLGMRRAYALADRLVWRMMAEPCEPPLTPPDPRLGPALESGDAGPFWLLDPSELMQGVPFPAIGGLADELERALDRALRRPGAEPPPPAPAMPDEPVIEADASDEEEGDDFEPSSGTGFSGRPNLRLIELSREDVDPLGEDADLPAELLEPHDDVPVVPQESVIGPAYRDAAPTPPAAIPPRVDSGTPVAPAPAIAAAPPPPAPPAPGVVAPAVATPAPASRAVAARRVLVAEDSITAAIFLERLLQQHGLVVRTVGSATDLRAMLGHERWDAVLADVDLPDAHGARWLRELTPRRDDGGAAPLIALVRDDEDISLARAAGITHMLRKPFERDDVAQVLMSLGVTGPARRS